MKFKAILTFIAVLIPFLIFGTAANASNHIDEQQKIWEDNFIQCVNQKQDISIVVSVDTSGSMKDNPGEWRGSDNDGFRWEAINALFYQLQQVAQSQWQPRKQCSKHSMRAHQLLQRVEKTYFASFRFYH